ncbi:geraniol 8-hydroxylase-like protein [Leptotrombidium deliense]|uniref:Geraniol 8-hydroxylase-like protein n=1 Tax=Leptotrombidium deliense TaxID=299467 RepID=A0A443S6N3_9ACAR|nr:geraniol 8-hydroxylase-like protein [Leptotrombidium deliense]
MDVKYLIESIISCDYYNSNLPGPYCLPIVGYLPFLGTRPHKVFNKLAEKYGPVFKYTFLV